MKQFWALRKFLAKVYDIANWLINWQEKKMRCDRKKN